MLRVNNVFPSAGVFIIAPEGTGAKSSFYSEHLTNSSFPKSADATVAHDVASFSLLCVFQHLKSLLCFEGQIFVLSGKATNTILPFCLTSEVLHSKPEFTQETGENFKS